MRTTSRKGHRKHLVGVGPGQIVAGGEGQPGQVLQGLAILREEAQFVELLLVERDVLVDPGEGGLEPLQLHLSQLLPIHLLRILVEDCHCLLLGFLVEGRTGDFESLPSPQTPLPTL